MAGAPRRLARRSGGEGWGWLRRKRGLGVPAAIGDAFATPQEHEDLDDAHPGVRFEPEDRRTETA